MLRCDFGKTCANLTMGIWMCACMPSHAWDGGTTERIADSSLAALPGATGTFLRQMSPFFKSGLLADPETLQRYSGYPRPDTTGHAAGRLAGQIMLLRGLFPGELSPYMAYRMGVLARLLIDINAPYATDANPGREREMFDRDVGARRTELRYAPGPPKILRIPAREINAAAERSAGWTEPLKAQYRAGKGYGPVVRGIAEKAYGAAVQLAADSLHTVGSGGGAMPDAGSRFEFYADACEFYLDRKMGEEARAAYRMASDAASGLERRPVVSLEDAANRYALVVRLRALEERMREYGLEAAEPAGQRMLASLLSTMAKLSRKYADAGEQGKARAVLMVCLREGYLPDWTLGNLGNLHGLDVLENLDVPENAWKIYREGNRFETMAGTAYAAGRTWEGNDLLSRAAALYARIPPNLVELKKAAGIRIEQIGDKLRSSPATSFFNEDLFQEAVETLKRGDIDSAIRGFRLSRQWGADEKATEGAVSDAEALRIFNKGKEFYEAKEYDRAARYFRRVSERFPGSPFAAPAKRMVAAYESMREADAGRRLLLLKGAYEASFVGDEDTVYGLCDEILKSSPEEGMRDRAQLLIAVAWYESGQRGYQKIDRVLRDLLKHRVLDEDEGKLVLKKKIDFYFGLRDRFPEMELAELKEDLLDRIGLRGMPAAPDAMEEAEDALRRAREEVDAVEELIRGEEDLKRDTMREARSILDKAVELLDDAKELFDSEQYPAARERADEAYEKAAEARLEAERALGVTEDLRKDAARSLDEARDSVSEAEAAFLETEDLVEEARREGDREFEKLKSDLEDLQELLREAERIFNEGDYEAAKEKTEEVLDKSREVKTDAENLKDETEKAMEEEDEEETEK